ncbi:hypothetical protein SAMN04489798_2234 [Pseudomonas arsenicoxydans]|uniref:Uncharacterized protein n=1 Tax=Pseudomonas arsenicoxydans TaxID=702115 RepID=A0A1H0HDZ5_9PSED|nr:hypothetical protein SAMN04489798_2234 [Pseudomonas arsenicoxydans]
MFKKLAITVPMTLLALSSSVAFAADEIRSSINISANIPTWEFHAQPVNPDFGKDEKMAWNVITESLAPLRATYDIRHSLGSVNAYVRWSATPAKRRQLHPADLRLQRRNLDRCFSRSGRRYRIKRGHAS